MIAYYVMNTILATWALFGILSLGYIIISETLHEKQNNKKMVLAYSGRAGDLVSFIGLIRKRGLVTLRH